MPVYSHNMSADSMTAEGRRTPTFLCVSFFRHVLAFTLVGIAVTAVASHRAAAQPQPLVSVNGLFTEAQARRGAVLYTENCAQCHRYDLAAGDLAPALVGPAFTLRWAGGPLSELFDFMRTQMPLTSPGGLSAQQNADLLAFLLEKNGYAAGTTDLPAAGGELAGLKLSTP